MRRIRFAAENPEGFAVLKNSHVRLVFSPSGAMLVLPTLGANRMEHWPQGEATPYLGFVEGGMPLPTASQCAIVVSVKAITKGRSIHSARGRQESCSASSSGLFALPVGALAISDECTAQGTNSGTDQRIGQEGTDQAAIGG
ncbi:hypothetical protein JHX88_17500 [Paracoccus saliphilus]|uniref:Uncharacterized protein n=1 Tax=Paracoccus saliphilus TaxID=405559 RepID=A0ABY7S6D1_9RHOB|nr:hypothetical protein JHX88_17500 [Paracoccus saliphilus]